MIGERNFDFNVLGKVKQLVAGAEAVSLVYASRWKSGLREITLRGDSTDLNDVDEFLEHCMAQYVLGEVSVRCLRLFALALTSRVQEISLQKWPRARRVDEVNQVVQAIFDRVVAMKKKVPQ